MSYRDFENVFYEILARNPFPNGDQWYFQPLGNSSLANKGHWMEMLYRTRASYWCNRRHSWQSAWTMILFRFELNRPNHSGRVRMKRFGLRCKEEPCKDDLTYHTGFCREHEVWWLLQCLLLYIFQRFYERRRHLDADNLYYIIPVDNVGGVRPGGSGGSPHQRHCCEACAHNQCQDKFKQLTKKNT